MNPELVDPTSGSFFRKLIKRFLLLVGHIAICWNVMDHRNDVVCEGVDGVGSLWTRCGGVTVCSKETCFFPPAVAVFNAPVVLTALDVEVDPSVFWASLVWVPLHLLISFASCAKDFAAASDPLNYITFWIRPLKVLRESPPMLCWLYLPVINTFLPFLFGTSHTCARGEG